VTPADYYVKRNRTGAYPLSSLIQVDGYLYGTTSLLGGGDPAIADTEPQYTGIYGFGTVFRLNPNVLPYVIEPRLTFTNNTTPESRPSYIHSHGLGASPAGRLILAHDDTLVGTAAGGGGLLLDRTDPETDIFGQGTLFKFDPSAPASDDPVAPLFVFGEGGDTYNFGVSPQNGVIELPEAGGGYAHYGIAGGGPYGAGTVFKIGNATNAQPLGTPIPFDDGGGAFDWRWLSALLLLSAASALMRRRALTTKARRRD
jgi:hypothetical protein